MKRRQNRLPRPISSTVAVLKFAISPDYVRALGLCAAPCSKPAASSGRGSLLGAGRCGGRPPFLGCAIEMAPTAEGSDEFVPIFHGPDGKQMDADARVAALQDPAAVPVYTNLDALWSGPARALFPAGYHQDHPNEASAYIFADLCKLALEDSGVLSPELDEERKTVLRQLGPAFEHWLRQPASL